MCGTRSREIVNPRLRQRTGLLEVRDLTIDYQTQSGPVPAVRGVDLTIERGFQVLGPAGESGCGKSTIGLGLMRLLPSWHAMQGRVTLNGEDVLDDGAQPVGRDPWTQGSIIFQGAQHALDP